MSFRTGWWIVKFYLKCSWILLPVSGILKNVTTRNRGRSWDLEIGQSVVRHQSSWNSTIIVAVTVTVTITIHTGVKFMMSDRWATGAFWAFDLFSISHFPSSSNIFSTAVCFLSRVAVLCLRRLVRTRDTARSYSESLIIIIVVIIIIIIIIIIITDKCVIFFRRMFSS
jgi:hypothetical protein